MDDMSFFSRFFRSSKTVQEPALLPLYKSIVAKAREVHWYKEGQVPDSVDGRFEILSTLLTLIMLRLETEPDQAENAANLTEIFIADMDGQLREIGIGDMIVGKHIGKMMSALGGRLGAYREAFANPALLDDVIVRNVYGGEKSAGVEPVRAALIALQEQLQVLPVNAILAGSF
jgi:cytochrome b pre-mRNA-processing protein 3